MAKFYGTIGYGESVNVSPGVWKDQVTEKQYYGDIQQNIRKLNETDKVNDDLVVQNTISIVADAYAMDHFFAIRYIIWAGAYWTISEVQVQRPRLVLRLGGVYNGPKA